jgi:leucyl-tRNA synthetase
MRRYNPQELEPKWQKVWQDTGLYKADMKRTDDKFYVIPMFPYPSGDLHIGHWYNFGPTDTVARFNRMMGRNVLTTIGFDAFGLPAENAAIKRGIQPAKWTRSNMASMVKQLKSLGASYDWDHSLATCDPSYYRWNQWFFLQLYEKGLAYRKKAWVNWCPKDQTVLANEQVVGENNVCERCGTPVIQKELEQWFYKITDYADRLLDDLDKVEWPARVKTMQLNWIGRSQGALIDFEAENEVLSVFTTRPDTIYGATYMVIAPEHPLVNKLVTAEQKPEVVDYIAEAGRKTELERKEGEKNKTGVFSGSYAINPATKKPIPVWIADYVLMSYGTGAIMAVPAHDQRDLEFAQKFELPITQVIEPTFGDPQLDEEHKVGVNVILRNPITDEIIILDWGNRQKNFGGKMLIGGGVEAGEDIVECAKREIAEETGYTDIKLVARSDVIGHGHFFSNVKNKNFSIDAHGLLFDLASDKKEELNLDPGEKNKFTVNWVPAEEAVNSLDDGIHKYFGETLVLNRAYSGEGLMINSGPYDGQTSSVVRDSIVADLNKKGIAKEQTNYRLRDWLISRQRYWGTPIPIIYCDHCGTVPVPEDQLPIILPEDVEFELSGQSPLQHRPDFVDTLCPKCGRPAKRETDTMDTFMDSSWYFLRYIDNHNNEEIFDKELINKWMPVDHYIGGIEHAILHLLYARFMVKFLHDHHNLAVDEPFKRLTNQGIILGPDGQKMSKSRGNVVSPDEQVESYGADSLRLYMMFMGPYEDGGPYNLGGIAGTRRFLDRMWTLIGEFLEAPEGSQPDVEETAILAATHRAIKKVSRDLEHMGFNTAIAAMMALVNDLYKEKIDKGLGKTPAWQFAFDSLVQMVAPFAPHIAEELWQDLGHSQSVHISQWPLWDERFTTDETLTIAVQVNGKVRGQIVVDKDESEADVIAKAKADANVIKFLDGKKVSKVIYVPGRLVSLVV